MSRDSLTRTKRETLSTPFCKRVFRPSIPSIPSIIVYIYVVQLAFAADLGAKQRAFINEFRHLDGIDTIKTGN